MIKLREIADQAHDITIDDIMNYNDAHYRDSIRMQIIEDWYYSEDSKKSEWAREYIHLLNEVFILVKSLAAKLNVPHVDVKHIKFAIVATGGDEFKTRVDEFFPFGISIAAAPNSDGDWASITIDIDQNGKVLGIAEGNDEASPETIALVNKLVNPSGKPVRVYGMHGTAVCRKIEETGYLPANLYVSPDRGHASRHWDNTDRSMFTGVVNINDLSQESDLDWKTVGQTKIDKFRWL